MCVCGEGDREREGERGEGERGEKEGELVVYHKVWDFFFPLLISCDGPFAQKEKWHRKEHIIIIIIIKFL